MDEKPTGKIEAHLGKISDPRIGNAKRHKLLDLLVIAICAVICGADSWSDIELFGKNKQAWLKMFLSCRMGFLPMTPLGGSLP